MNLLLCCAAGQALYTQEETLYKRVDELWMLGEEGEEENNSLYTYPKISLSETLDGRHTRGSHSTNTRGYPQLRPSLACTLHLGSREYRK